MYDLLLTLPWWLYCIILILGAATFSITLRYVDDEMHPSLFGFGFCIISTTILSVTVLLHVIGGQTLEMTKFALCLAIISGTAGVGIDRGIISMYRAGAPVSLGTPLIRALFAITTAIIGVIFFAEDMDWIKVTGILFGTIGIFLTFQKD